MVNSSDSVSYCLESQQKNKSQPPSSSSPKRKHEDDENVSYTEAIVRRRKQQKKYLIWNMKDRMLAALLILILGSCFEQGCPFGEAKAGE
ncbi:unnamed protein product [Brassica oleracea]